MKSRFFSLGRVGGGGNIAHGTSPSESTNNVAVKKTLHATQSLFQKLDLNDYFLWEDNWLLINRSHPEHITICHVSQNELALSLAVILL